MWFVSQCERVALFVPKAATPRQVGEWALKHIPDMCAEIDVFDTVWDDDMFVQIEDWEDGDVVLWGDDGIIRFEPADEGDFEIETFAVKGEIVC